MDYNVEKNLLRYVNIFRLFFIKFLIIGLFANSLLPQACFCGEACRHGLQGKETAGLIFLFHNRCSGTHCKSCNFEEIQTLRASNATHSKEIPKSLHTLYILSNYSDNQRNIHFIKVFFSRLESYVKVKFPPNYLQNLSLLL